MKAIFFNVEYVINFQNYHWNVSIATNGIAMIVEIFCIQKKGTFF